MKNIELRTLAMDRKFISFDFGGQRECMPSAPGSPATAVEAANGSADVPEMGTHRQMRRPVDQEQALPTEISRSMVIAPDVLGVSRRQFHFFAGSVFLIASALLPLVFPEEFQAMRNSFLVSDAVQSHTEDGGILQRVVSMIDALSIPVLTFAYTVALTAGYYFRWIKPARLKTRRRRS